MVFNSFLLSCKPVKKDYAFGKGKREYVVIYLSSGVGLLSSGIGHPESVSLIGNLSLNISESLLFLEESPGHPLLLALLWAHPVLSGLVQIGFVQREPFHDNNDHSLNTLYIWFFAKGRLSGLATILMD